MQSKLIGYLTCMGFILSLFLSNPADAQRRKDKRNGTPEIMKDLPSFFVSDHKLPDYLKEVYKQDATRLSIRLLNKEQSLSKQTIIVPEELVQAVYNALVAIRTSSFSAIDTIAAKYNVRSFPIPNVENIILVFEHDDDRLESIKRRRSDTLDDPNFNALMRQYDLRIARLAYLDEERAGMVLYARNPINVPALAYKMFMLEGIGSIEEVLPYGDGNDIQIERTKEGWNLNYSVKFGNCTNQCQKAHNWNFSINEEGDVAYHGSSGQVIPPWITATAHAPKDLLKD